MTSRSFANSHCYMNFENQLIFCDRQLKPSYIADPIKNQWDILPIARRRPHELHAKLILKEGHFFKADYNILQNLHKRADPSHTNEGFCRNCTIFLSILSWRDSLALVVGQDCDFLIATSSSERNLELWVRVSE
jgi:hypothetical protein